MAAIREETTLSNNHAELNTSAKVPPIPPPNMKKAPEGAFSARPRDLRPAR